MEAPCEPPCANGPPKAPPSRCASTSLALSSTRRASSRPPSFFKFSEQRPSQTLLLKLDAPLRINLEDQGCVHRREIAIFDDPDKLTKWIGRDVIITGELGRFGSALVSPSIYIEISNIKDAAKR
jgi:hypothetical protein